LKCIKPTGSSTVGGQCVKHSEVGKREKKNDDRRPIKKWFLFRRTGVGGGSPRDCKNKGIDATLKVVYFWRGQTLRNEKVCRTIGETIRSVPLLVLPYRYWNGEKR